MPKSEFAVSQAIDQTRKILNAALKKRVIEVQIDTKDDFKLFGNVNELIQVLINIVNNAKDAFDEMAKAQERNYIKISAFAREGLRFVEIENNAGRIDETLIDKIFEPRFTTKKSGSGLGLYMSKMIIEKNNAQIYARNINEGVLFTIKFKNS